MAIDLEVDSNRTVDQERLVEKAKGLDLMDLVDMTQKTADELKPYSHLIKDERIRQQFVYLAYRNMDRS